MVSSRIFHTNYLTDNNPTVTLFASGGAVAGSAATVSDVQPIKLGWATGNINPASPYTGIIDRFYRIEIVSAGTGAFGSATWRWTDAADTPGFTWNATGLATQNNVYVALSNGIQWRFTSVGSNTPQFALGDRWDFAVRFKYGYRQGQDGMRDHEYRSGTMPAASTIEHRYDFGAAVSPTAFAMLDDNIPSNGTVSLKAKASGYTDPPTVTLTVPWQAGKKALLITGQSYRYWRVCITLGATPLTYLRWSEMFLGDSLVFDRTFNSGYQRSLRALSAVNADVLRRGPGPRRLKGDVLQLTYAYMSSADRTRMDTLAAWVDDATNGLQRAFYVLPMDDDLSDLSLYHWINDYEQQHEFLERATTTVEWQEVVRTVA